MPVSPHIAACEEALSLLSKPHPRYTIQAVESVERLRQLWEIDKSAYLDCSLPFEPFLEWWQRYEFGSRILLESDRIVASLGIYPLSGEQYNAFHAGSIREALLKPVPFQACEIESCQHWYASGIVVAESDRGWGSPLLTLLSSGLRCWLDSGHLSYPLSIMAIAEYDAGARLLELFSFSKAKDKSEMPDGCDLYELKIANRKQALLLLKQRIR